MTSYYCSHLLAETWTLALCSAEGGHGQHSRLPGALPQATAPSSPSLFLESGIRWSQESGGARNQMEPGITGYFPTYGQRHDIWAQCHVGRRPSSDDSLHSPTVIPLSALGKPSIMKRYHRRRTCSHTSPRRSPTIVTLSDTRFVECR